MFSPKQMPTPQGLVILLQTEVSEGHSSNQSPAGIIKPPTLTLIHIYTPPMMQVGSEGQGLAQGMWHRQDRGPAHCLPGRPLLCGGRAEIG